VGEGRVLSRALERPERPERPEGFCSTLKTHHLTRRY